MRAHEAPRTRSAGRPRRAIIGVATAVATALLAASCAGPAQDVPPADPDPIEGTAGSTVESAPAPDTPEADVDGAVAALEQYLALEQRVYRTGDAGELERMSAPECAACATKRDIALEAVAAGIEIEAGPSRVELVRRVPAEEVVAPEDLDPEMDKDVYLLETRVHTTGTTLRTPEGEDHIPAGQYGLRATLLAGPDGSWYVVDLTESA